MIKRILKDIKDLFKIAPDTVVDTDNVIFFSIKGPTGTIYETGTWKIRVQFPTEYPYKSPSVGFVDKIYHPNVDFKSGTICLNVLNKSWTPIYNISHIYSIFLPQLLQYPNADDPLNVEAGDLFLQNIETFNKNVLIHIEKHCKTN